jgi:TM2 domain-containing membrane protein YozV
MTARTFGRRGGGDGGTFGAGHGAGAAGGFGARGAGEDPAMAARRAAFLAEERARADRPPESSDGLDRTLDMPRSGPIFIREKSMGTAYLLWFFLGGFGAHRFYLGFPVSAAIQMILWPVCYMVVMTGSYGAVYPMMIGALWILIDAFLIPGLARQANEKARRNAVGYNFM